MRFGLLGPLAVWTDEGVPVSIPGAKVRALLADLLIHVGEPVSADRLVEDLWGDDAPANPLGSLQAKVSQLRRSLEQAEPGARSLVVSRSPGYLLAADEGAVDVRRFETLRARAGAAGEPHAAATLGEALALWRGPALADFADDDFARPAVTRFEEQRLTTLEEHGEARLALGEHATLAGELDDLVTRHPLRERLRAVQLRALYRAGRQAEALAAYQQLRTRLAEDLGVDPGPELAQLHQAILTQDPAVAAPTTAQHTTQHTDQHTRPRTNLPASLSSLVGRTASVGDVRKQLDNARLVTLTGPGGVGKTRLALQAAAELVDDMPDGAWVVELAGRDTPCGERIGCMVELVVAALGVREDSARIAPPAGECAGLADRLAAALRSQQLLLVLDNCEQAVDAAAELAGLLLRSAPGLRILATSREPLGVSGELLSPVPALELPGPGTDDDPDALLRCSAVQMFVQRATAAAPGFALTPHNAPAVAALCRRLDGLPLALELAAARVRVLPVGELATRLDDRFRLLAAGARDAPARQQTLRAVVDWSWELLGERERAVLRRLAVFADGFTLAAAEAVCTGEGVDGADVLDLLARLVDRSLVVADAGGGRYRLLETIAVYALERLDEAEETASTRRRHAHHYAELARQGDGQLRGHGQRHWLERLDAETANIRAALTWTSAQPDAVPALRLAGSMAWYWFLRGRHSEGHRWLTAVLAATDGTSTDSALLADRARVMCWLTALGSQAWTGDTAEHGRAALEIHRRLDGPAGLAQAQWLLGFVLAGGGEPSSGAELLDEALSNFRRLGDRWGVAAALSIRGWEQLRRGDLDSARRDVERSWSLFGEVGDRWVQVRNADLLGVLAEIEGDYDRATVMHAEGLRLAEEIGLWPVAAHQLGRLGRLEMLAGDYAAALDHHQRALQLAQEQAFDSGITFAQVGLGLVARRQGRLDDAEAQLQAMLAAHRVAGFHPGVAFVLAELGFVAELRGDAGAARTRHLDGLAAARLSGDPRAIALALEGLAGADALDGEHRRAAALLGAADAARNSVDRPLPAVERGDVDRITASARAALGDDTFALEFDRGGSEGLGAALAALAALTTA